MESFILVLHVLVAMAMIGFILLQQGKGAEMGASFGAGASQTVFGAAGAAGFLTKLTAILAAIFFATSLGLAVYARQHAQGNEALPGLPAETAPEAAKPEGDVPVAPAAPETSNTDVPVVPAQ